VASLDTRATSRYEIFVVAQGFPVPLTPSRPRSPPADHARPVAQPFEDATWVAVTLSGVAGYVDTAGFIALFGLFTAHVTGDLVAVGAVIAERPTLAVIGRLAMIPTFMLSVAGAALFVRRQKRRRTPPLASLLALMTAALAMFCVTGVVLHPLANAPDVWAVGLIGGIGVVSMAIQNTLMRDVLRSCCPTTIMTGNLTQVTIDLVDLVFEPAQGDSGMRRVARAEAKARLFKFGLPLVGFMAGAGMGAVLTHGVGLASIAVPTVAVGALTAIVWRGADRSSEPQRLREPSKPALSASEHHEDGEAVARSSSRVRKSAIRLVAARAAIEPSASSVGEPEAVRMVSSSDVRSPMAASSRRHHEPAAGRGRPPHDRR